MGTLGLRRVELISYYAEGLASTSPLHFMVRNQNTSPIYGNVHANHFPLYFNKFPNCFTHLEKPLVITEGQCWNNAHVLQFDILDSSNNQPAVFTSLYLMFRVEDNCEPLPTNLDIDQELQQM